MAFFLENFMNYKNMDELRKELDILDNELIKIVKINEIDCSEFEIVRYTLY